MLSTCVAEAASAGRIVEKLVARGLVHSERPANDLRVVLARITEQGRRLAEAVVQGPAQADLLTRLERLDPEEIEAIDRTLRRVVVLLDAETVEARPLFDEGKPGGGRGRRRG